MVSPRLVVEENCQLRTSATWSHVPTGGLVKKFTFCTETRRPDKATVMGKTKKKRSPSPSGVQLLSTRGCCLTFGWLVSMLYHRMEAQALGIWQMLEMTTTGRE